MPSALSRRRQGGALGVVAGEDRVLRPGAQVAFGDGGGCDGAGQELAVSLGDLLAEVDLLREDGELGQEDRGLQGVQAAVDPDPDVLVLVAPLAVDPDRAEDLGRSGRRS